MQYKGGTSRNRIKPSYNLKLDAIIVTETQVDKEHDISELLPKTLGYKVF